MQPIRRQSLVEQTASHLRDGFRSGRWSGQLPGVLSLANELGVSKDTVRDTLNQLEGEGHLMSCGAGKHRQIVSPRNEPPERQCMRVSILLSEPLEGDNAQSQHLLMSVRRAIETAGHICGFADKALSQIGHKIPRVASLVKATQADAWIVSSGSREVLEWFAGQPVPMIALGGRCAGLPIASCSLASSVTLGEAVRVLAGHGHRRIVFLSPPSWRQPTHGPSVTAFFAALQSLGITATDYHLPQWEESADGLAQLLEALFRITPPTALILVEPAACVATLAFLAQRGIHVPRDLSLICLVYDPVFAWRRPAIAHFKWEPHKLIHRVARWVDAVACGTADYEQKNYTPTFDPGGTIAAARKTGP